MEHIVTSHIYMNSVHPHTGWTTDSDSQRGVRERQPVEGLVERASDAPGGGQRLKLLLDW